MSAPAILKARQRQVYEKGAQTPFDFACEKPSVAGSVSQRACVFCGSRVVLYPITDALHLIHGSAGCAAYTWDIRGSLSSGPELHRLSFTTDLREHDVIFGGEPKLYRSLIELIERYAPKAAFVYATCIVGVIGDDVAAVCRRVSQEKGLPVIPVHSEGFGGTKKDGYKAACKALEQLIGTDDSGTVPPVSINILGEFNLAGEAWIIREYYRRLGVNVVAVLTGDGRVDDIRRAHRASLNVVQCAGSLSYLAETMRERYGIPFIRVSYFGLEDVAKALYDVADFFQDRDPELPARASALVLEQASGVQNLIREYRAKFAGRTAAIYVGGAFKTFSLIRMLRLLGVKVALVGSQTGKPEDYAQLRDFCDDETVIVDDSNPLELAHYLKAKNVDLFIGGVKERPLAYKLGIGFLDHNHERKLPLAGFEGVLYFAREMEAAMLSPVWRFAPRREVRHE